MRARAIAFASAALALFSIVAAARSHDARAQAAALSSSGDVKVANSRNGSAILSGALGPGDSLTGTVTISNIGSGAGDFVLGLSHLMDAPGPGGGFFSRRLDLAVDDVTVPSAPVAVYRGRLNSLNPTALGTFAPGAAHTYRFAVTWAPSAADPTMYGSSMSVEFDWSAADTVRTPVLPPPGPPPAGSPVTTTVAPPRVSVSIRSPQPVLKRGSVQASAACDEACTIVATGSVSVPGVAHAYKLVPARGSLMGAGKARLRLRLPRTARKPLRSALSAHRKAFARIVIQAAGPGGKGAPVKRKIRIIG